MIKILSFDPGGTTGLAVASFNPQSRRGTVLSVEAIPFPKVFDRLLEFDANVWLYEGYKIRTRAKDDGWSHDWDDGKALQVIGAIRANAARCGAVEAEQQPSIKPMGYGYMGDKYVKNKKGQHIKDALAHLHFYLVKKHLAAPKCLSL